LNQRILFFFALTISLTASANAQKSDSLLPHLEKRGQATQLVVEGKPFLVLGGEVHNSSSSSPEYMKAVWPQLAAKNLNTVLLPVAWETIEPQENKFDFTCVDGLLAGAHESNLHIVILWFGAWKNTFSSYAPGWVKSDTQRFPRVQASDGRSTDRLSPFNKTVLDADANAFARLMEHLHSVDAERHTILMVQVENEVGVIPEARDYSSVANQAFAGAVPNALTSYLEKHRAELNPDLRTAWESAGSKKSGSWQDVFGKTSLTDDLFMSWQYASYIQQVAAAGKAKYSLPMFANAALIRPNYEPGQYNSGGPLPHSMDLWRAAAPALDFLSPDIYFNEFALWAQRYSRPGNPLFIPETQGGAPSAANALYAFGQLSAIGFSPFGIDEQGNLPLDLAGITNPTEKPDESTVRNIYLTLTRLTPLILEKQQTGEISAVLMEGEAQRSARIAIGDYTADIVRAGRGPAGERIGVMFIQTAPTEFLVLGNSDAQITFSTTKPGLPTVGIESIDEEFYESGSWVPHRRMNGDESSQGKALRITANDLAAGRIYRLRLYRYR
jgi:hypothetical protein